MSIRTSATRYARALFDVATNESDPATIEQNLVTIVNAMRDNADLRRVMTSPGIPATARRNVIERVARLAGTETPVTKLLLMLADRGRLEILPTLLEVYRERLLAHQNIVRGSVTSAAPLSSEQLRALESSLAGVTGKQVQLDASVDADLVGGVVARIGSTVYDGSLRTQLDKMRQRLVEGA